MWMEREAKWVQEGGDEAGGTVVEALSMETGIRS